MQHNAVPIVHRLSIHCDLDGELQLLLQMGDDFSLPYTQSFTGPEFELAEPPLLLKAQSLVATLETTRSYLLLEIKQQGEIVHQQHWPVEVLAYNHWPGLSRGIPDLLCSFVMPHHPAVSQLVHQAGQFVPSLDGYQSGHAYEQARAVYQAVQALELQYLQGGDGWAEVGQKIRTPDQLIEHRQGNCLDITCLMAAALRRIGLHPLLILVDGHAFPGCWLRPDDDPDGPLGDLSTLQKCLALGLVCLFDSSSVCGQPFEKAEETARSYLTEEKFQLALDLRASERQGIRPLPLRLTTAGEVVLIHEEGTPERGLAPRAQEAIATPHLPKEPWEKRLQGWKNRLLDITTRNRLLDMRPESNRRLLPLLLQRPQQLLESLLNNSTYTLVGRPRILGDDDPRSVKLAGEEQITREVEENFQNRRLQVNLDEGETQRRSLELFRADRVNLEETGSSTLFLALGTLRWTETDKASVKRTAPVALLPVELVRVRVHEPYKLRWRGEDLRINLTLLRKLQADFKIDLSHLENWEGPDVADLLQQLRGELLNQSGWNLYEECAVGSFSFAKLLMLQDLERFPNLHTGSPMLRRFLTGVFEAEQQLVDSRQVEKQPPATCVLDADSSQLAAVHSSAARASFVLQGPPGTGKSQTITNIIAENLFQGRTVLFVAEKLAALEVVYRRLQRHGLGPFCLQLHSNKASKAEILSQLRESLEFQAPPAQTGNSARLRELENELNDYVELLHSPRPLGLTIYQAIARCSELPYQPLECPIPPDFAEREAVLRHARDLKVHLKATGPPDQHPWRESRLTHWDGESRARLSQLLERGFNLLTPWQALLEEGAGLWNLPRPPLPAELPLFHQLVQLLRDSPLPPDQLLDKNPWREVRAVLDPALQILAERQEIWADLSPHFDEGLLQLDLVALRARFEKWRTVFLLGYFMLWSARRRLRKVARRKVQSGAALMVQLQVAINLVELDARLQKIPAASYLGSRWQGPHTDLSQARSMVEWAGQFRQALSELPGDLEPFRLALRLAANREERLQGAPGRWLDNYLQQSAELQKWWAELHHHLQLHSPLRGWGEWREWLERQRRQLDRLPDWTLFQESAQALERLHLGEVVRVLPADLEEVAELSLLQGWLQAVVPHRTRGGLQQERVEEFRRLDLQRLADTPAQLAQTLSSRIPPVQEQGAKGEMAVLLRELKKQRNVKAPRQLFKEVGNLLTRLKPCLLMSPLSIAQYLDPANPPFDLVVFDEASQIAPWDALGALARGRQWVVVGDSRQLPPTTFFAAQVEEDDEEVDLGGSLESILDECSAAGLPQLTLNWHYRSSDERLIAFSNRHYYEGRLLTFPNPARESRVHWVHVPEGVFARSASRTNRLEAERLVEQMVERLRDPNTHQSFGVVTFNQAQQNLIENLLDAARARHPEIERHFVDCLEPVFVKNLENVQGDERDVILFSIAYAPDSTGKFRMEFGPLNRQGGERRLNVAVSRARQQMWVYSSIVPEQIDLNRAQARGARDLRSFLEYARRGGSFAGSEGGQPDPLTTALASALRERGLTVTTNLGSSHYRLDLTLDQAALEWDGPHYHQAHSTRDRDRLRQQVLKGLGWRLKRVWAPDWWRNRDRVVEEVLEWLQSPASASASSQPDSAAPASGAAPSGTAPSGGASSTAPSGGAASGAVDSGGASSGAVASGGASSGAVASGGASSGGASSGAAASGAAAPGGAGSSSATSGAVPSGPSSSSGPPFSGAAATGTAAAGAVSSGAPPSGAAASALHGLGATQDEASDPPSTSLGDSAASDEPGGKSQRKAPTRKSAKATEAVIPLRTKAVPMVAKPYREADLGLPQIKCEPHKLSAPQFLEIIQPLLQEESPLMPAYLMTRVSRCLGARNLGSRMRTHFEGLLQTLAAKGDLLLESDQTIWASLAQRQSWSGFRTGDRTLAEVPPIELEAAIAHEMALAISLTEPELVRSVARHFGKQKAGSEFVVARLHRMLETGRCRRHGDNWVWVG